MNHKKEKTKLEEKLEQDLTLRQKSEHEKTTVLGQTVFLGSLGLMLILPTVAGAYLGRWLDEHASHFSFSWTISLILIGLGIGIANVIFFIREH